MPLGFGQLPTLVETPFGRGKVGRPPGVLPEVDGIQVNHCRNVECENFGVSPRQDVRRGRSRRHTPRVSDDYRIVGKRTQTAPKNLLCTKCQQRSSIKSSLGIKENLTRISAYLAPSPAPSCPNARCKNRRVPISASGRYYRQGRRSTESCRNAPGGGTEGDGPEAAAVRRAAVGGWTLRTCRGCAHRAPLPPSGWFPIEDRPCLSRPAAAGHVTLTCRKPLRAVERRGPASGLAGPFAWTLRSGHHPTLHRRSPSGGVRRRRSRSGW